MEITRPSVALETPAGMQSWIDRRREEYRHTSKTLKVVGSIGWLLVALNVVAMVR
jgi:hypothetical protein